jgi:hypothetical protein
MNKPTPLAILGTLLLAALAGCADNGAKDSPTTDQAPTDELEKQVGATPSNLTKGAAVLSLDTPFLLSAEAGPDAPVSAFLWKIPKGGIIEYQPIPDFPDFVIKELVFGMVPVFPDGNASLDEFSLLVFRLGSDAELAAAYVGVPMQGVFSDVLTSSDLSSRPELGPTWLYLGAGSLEEGDTLAFVFAAKAEKAMPVGLLLSPQSKDPDASPAADADELLGNRTAVSLPLAGSGAGFQYAAYLNFNLIFLTSIIHQEFMTDTITVEDRVRGPAEPLATVRDATVSASYDGAGFSTSVAEEFVFSFLVPCAAAGKFDIELDAHGTVVSERNLILETPAASAYLVTGLPLAFATGEGSGSSSSSLDFQLGSGCGLEIGVLEQMDLGATLGQLTGVPAATGGAAFSGLVGNIPPVMFARGGDLFIGNGRSMTQVAGMGHVLDPVEEARAMAAQMA